MTNVVINLTDGQAWDRFRGAVEEFLPTPELIVKAIASTNQRLTRWLRTRALRELSKQLHLPQRILRSRFKTFSVVSEVRGGKLWLGIKGIPFAALQPEKAGRGVKTKIGSFYEEGAFIQTLKKGDGKGRLVVLKRRAKTWDGPGKRGKTDAVRVNIQDKSLLWLQAVLDRPDFAQEYFKRLEAELKWRTS